METQGERRDRQRELRALESIAASLALPYLRNRWERITAGTPKPEAQKMQRALNDAEARLGVPHSLRTGERRV